MQEFKKMRTELYELEQKRKEERAESNQELEACTW
jgi:hypothetical protein